MQEFIDLSYPIHQGMSVYPGDSQVRLDQVADIENDGFRNFELASGMHVGTHVDGQAHMLSSQISIGDYPLDRFAGKAVMVDVRKESSAKVSISAKEVKKIFEKIQNISCLILWTGWSELYGEADYYENHPYLSTELVDLLLEKQISLIGMDMPSPDHAPFLVHQRLLKEQVVILENVTHLDFLKKTMELREEDYFFLTAFPLKIEADSSMVRALAILGQM